MPRDHGILLDIYDAAQGAISYVSGMDFHAFEADRKTRRAVACEILIIGEATKNLSKEFRESHPRIPWSPMAGMRDKLIHDYDQVQTSFLWITVQDHMPKLVHQLNLILADLPQKP